MECRRVIQSLPLAIHEIMHNWWYAAVANDENRNALAG